MDPIIKYRLPKPIRQKQINPAWDSFNTGVSKPIKLKKSGVRFTPRAKNWDPTIDCFPPIPSSRHHPRFDPVESVESSTDNNTPDAKESSITEDDRSSSAISFRSQFALSQASRDAHKPKALFDSFTKHGETNNTQSTHTGIQQSQAHPSHPKSQSYVLQFDGGSRGNPGPSGSGSVIYDPSGQMIWTGYHYLGKKTNNQAEYQGLINGLATVVALLVRQVNTPTPPGSETINGLVPVQSLLIQGDSDLVIKQLKGRYQVKSKKLKPLYDTAVQYLEQLRDPQLGLARIRMEHIYRNRNQMADALANQAMDTRSQDSQWLI